MSEDSHYYPVFLRLEGQKVLLVGGGAVATRKVSALVEAGAMVGIVSKDLSPSIRSLIDTSKIHYLGSEFQEAMLDGVSLAVVATDDQELNQRVFEACKKKRIWVNVVDNPKLCTFLVPAVIKKGDLRIAISTGGKSPATARLLREILEAMVPEGIEAFLKVMGLVRRHILALGLGSEENKRIFNRIVRSDLIRLLREGDIEGIEGSLNRLLPPGTDSGSLLCEIKTILGTKCT